MQVSEREGETEKVGNGKICEQCGQFRDRSQFRKHHRAKDGLQSVCIICKPKKTPNTNNKSVVSKVIPNSSNSQEKESKIVFITINCGNSSVKFQCEFQDSIEIKLERD